MKTVMINVLANVFVLFSCLRSNVLVYLVATCSILNLNTMEDIQVPNHYVMIM